MLINLYILTISCLLISFLLKGVIAIASYIIGILFMFGNGYYYVDVFDLFGATFPLLLIAICESLGVLFYSAKLKDKSTKELFTAGIKKYATVYVLAFVSKILSSIC